VRVELSAYWERRTLTLVGTLLTIFGILLVGSGMILHENELASGQDPVYGDHHVHGGQQEWREAGFPPVLPHATPGVRHDRLNAIFVSE
jgi:hypothetical protein